MAAVVEAVVDKAAIAEVADMAESADRVAEVAD